MMGTRVGFHADAYADRVIGRGWYRLDRWRWTGNNELYSFGGGISNTFYTAPQAGYYMCAAQVRIDSKTSQRMKMVIALNNQPDVHSGLHASVGNMGSTNYRSLSLVGSVWLTKGLRVSVHTYSQYDNSYRVQHESGFSCHKYGS